MGAAWIKKDPVVIEWSVYAQAYDDFSAAACTAEVSVITGLVVRRALA
jgi:hypothetical protein